MSGRPSPAFAAEEQHRGDGLAARIGQIAEHPGNPSANSLPLYREAARAAFETAAAHTDQPKDRP